MLVNSFLIKGERGNIVLNLNYNATLQHYNFVSANMPGINGQPLPVPLPLFNRVYENVPSAKIAAQQWVNNLEITEGQS